PADLVASFWSPSCKFALNAEKTNKISKLLNSNEFVDQRAQLDHPEKTYLFIESRFYTKRTITPSKISEYIKKMLQRQCCSEINIIIGLKFSFHTRKSRNATTKQFIDNYSTLKGERILIFHLKNIKKTRIKRDHEEKEVNRRSPKCFYRNDNSSFY